MAENSSRSFCPRNTEEKFGDNPFSSEAVGGLTKILIVSSHSYVGTRRLRS